LNARYSRLVSLSEELGRQVDHALEMVKRRTSLRDSLRLALTLLRFLIAGLVLALLVPLDPTLIPIQTLAGLLLATALGIWLVEFFVERHILRNPESWALRLTPLARGIATLMRPIIILPSRLANLGDGPRQLVTITEEELRSFVDASQREGVLEKDERQMIVSMLEFGDTLVREIMVPRIDIFALDVATPIDQIGDALLESGYSRVPIYKDSIDNIVGLLYAKDLLKVWRTPEKIKSITELLRPANFVPESKKLDDLLAEMQGGRIHIAIVVDEFGGVAGLVTMEDMMEEIVGEIQDEYDHGEELAYQKVENGDFVFHGRITLNDFNEVMTSDLQSEDADTLGGFLFGLIGHVPKVGQKIEQDGVILTIEQVVGRRIRRVRAHKTQPLQITEEQKTNAK
jgi:CBS domain containing-hemolysin-like protein